MTIVGSIVFSLSATFAMRVAALDGLPAASYWVAVKELKLSYYNGYIIYSR